MKRWKHPVIYCFPALRQGRPRAAHGTCRLADGRAACGGGGAAKTGCRRRGPGTSRVKRQLGERGPTWWEDGAPDFNRHLARNTPYADWYAHPDPPPPPHPVAETARTGVT